jgi:hypothetical protein
VKSAGADFFAPGRYNRYAPVQLDSNVAAFATIGNHRSAETAKSTEKLITRHA